MALFEEMFSNGCGNDLFESAFGETITHTPQGVVANAVSLTAIVHRSQPTTDDDRGEGRIYNWEIEVDDSTTLTHDDFFNIDSLEFKAQTIGRSIAGLIEVGITYREEIYTTYSGNVVTGR